VKFTITVFGSKPEPLIVNVNACPAVTDVGVIEATCGAPVAAGTVTVAVFDGAPVDPFCTVTL
jgi:hypothetical protein